MTLNDDQRRLVEDYMNLVPFAVRRYLGSALAQDEDVISCGYLGLCRAAATYDASTGNRFSSLAVRCIINEIYNAYRPVRCQKHIPEKLCMSLEAPIHTSSEDGVMTLIDALGDDRADTQQQAMENLTAPYIANLAPLLFLKATQGLTYKQLAAHMGLSPQGAYNRCTTERQRLLRTLYPDLISRCAPARRSHKGVDAS